MKSAATGSLPAFSAALMASCTARRMVFGGYPVVGMAEPLTRSSAIEPMVCFVGAPKMSRIARSMPHRSSLGRLIGLPLPPPAGTGKGFDLARIAANPEASVAGDAGTTTGFDTSVGMVSVAVLGLMRYMGSLKSAWVYNPCDELDWFCPTPPGVLNGISLAICPTDACQSIFIISRFSPAP